MADSAPVVLSLCSGIGMLDEAVRLVFPGAVTAAYCEWEAYAASVLLARMEDATLEPAPVWNGDLRDFNAQPFRGVVDLLVAGLPCQPYSLAGKQRGNDDARSWGEAGDGPIPHFLRIVAECRPAVVFLENVPAWVMGGWFRPVGEELCRLGYEIEEPVFLAAGDVGASHERERVFVLAHLPGERGEGWRLPEPAVADANGLRRRSKGNGEQFATGAYWSGLPVFAPGPAAPEWKRIVETSPWLAPAIEPGLCVLAYGVALVVDQSRADQLRCAGNGVVALQAAVALVELLSRADQKETLT